MRTSIATVCLSGTLAEKLHAAAAAGFDGVEIFEPDLVASPARARRRSRALADRLGPHPRPVPAVPRRRGRRPTDEFARVLRRARCEVRADAAARHRHDAGLQQRRHRDGRRRRGLGRRSCAGSATAAATYGVRLAFEALAWGRFVDDYRRAWRIVELADHPAVGVCLDSFHILSRGHDPAAIEEIPGDEDLLPPARRRSRC